MSTPMYAVGVVLVLVTLVIALATPFVLVHYRIPYEHGPECWWCHPHLLPRRRRAR
ncbi:hypothetical protein SAMN04490357_0204 [Streptomyces misionensis]|uniref:Uncharacterized protein n=1 Tax=Streptomyces misionensis TaxID=67331 RepID=A0A1H4IEI5_9ACTN|nr:hypothetical protein [Streptomyces misionensis]SEB31748.1 hypothetical protein SAMN04490357_0204 [Streptomyces misionensis]